LTIRCARSWSLCWRKIGFIGHCWTGIHLAGGCRIRSARHWPKGPTVGKAAGRGITIAHPQFADIPNRDSPDPSVAPILRSHGSSSRPSRCLRMDLFDWFDPTGSKSTRSALTKPANKYALYFDAQRFMICTFTLFHAYLRHENDSSILHTTR